MSLHRTRAMEVLPIAKRSTNSDEVRSTEKLSRGRQYEAFAVNLAESLGYRVLAQNFRFHHLEGDLLLQVSRNALLIWEVRGRRTDKYIPSQMIHPKKLANIRRLAAWLMQTKRKQVRAQLVELIGPPENPRWTIYEIDDDR